MISSRSISAAILLTANISTVVAADPVVDDKPLKYWVERLNSNDETVRKAAAESLGQTAHEWFELRAQFSDEGITYCDRIRREAKPLIPTLIKRLGDPFDESRECAAYMIALVGPDAEAARPALLKMIRGERRSSGLPMAGAIALLHVTSPTRAVAREFLELVRDAPSEKSNNAPAVKDESSKPFGDDIIASMVGD